MFITMNYRKTYISFSLLAFVLFSCNPKDGPVEPPKPPDVTYPDPVDPPLANTVGFFLDDWKPRTFEIPEHAAGPLPTGTPATIVEVDASKVITKVSPSIFGQNAVSWTGKMVDQPVLMQHLNILKPGVIRFPGGALCDIYFWNRNMQDKPADVPDSMMAENGTKVLFRWNFWYGKANPPERADLDNYYTLLQQTGSPGMITVNYAYARYGTSANPVAQAAHLAADWVRFDNGRTKYWEIGNEEHGGWEAGYRIDTRLNKDGQPEFINGQLYGQHIKVFVDSMRKAANEIGKKIYIGAYVLEETPGSWLANASKAAVDWNRLLMTEMRNADIDYYIIHSYFTETSNVSFDNILNSANKTGVFLNYVKSQLGQYGAAVKPVALTEYNIFAQGSMQQVSYANGMHTVIVLGEAIKNLYGNAVRWDIANGWENGNDHGLFNLGDEPGGVKWNPRPVFYYMYYFQKTFGDRMLESRVNSSNILAYASSFSSGHKGVVLVNKSNSQLPVKINLKNANYGPKYYWYTLTGGSDNGDFSRKVFVNNSGGDANSGGPSGTYTSLKAFSGNTGDGIHLSVPARSVIYLVIDKKL